MATDYEPFPETALLALADHNENLARAWADKGAGARYREEHLKQAATCRDAVAAHTALRERCLLAEQDLRHRTAGNKNATPVGHAD